MDDQEDQFARRDSEPERIRLNRGGNRQTNAALHRIAFTQIRMHPDARAFITRRIEAGSTKREALRALKRKLANIVYRAMLADAQQPALEEGRLTIGETLMRYLRRSNPSGQTSVTP